MAYNNLIIPTSDSVKYLGLHLDKGLTWKQHIKAECNQLNVIVKQCYWLVGKRSNLSLENKLLLYKVILKSIWTYGIQLWGTASNCSIEILQRFQSKTARIITNASWYVTNETIYRDLRIPTIKEEISKRGNRYNSRVSNHPNSLVTQLLDSTVHTRKLKGDYPLDLHYKFV